VLYSRFNNYNTKHNIKKLVYKCCNIRKEEAFRIKTHQKKFCNSTIVYVEPNQNVKSGYFLKKDHTKECYNLTNLYNNNTKVNDNNNDKNHFYELCYTIMNTSDIYDRRLFKEKFKHIYNSNKYKFPLNNDMLLN